MVNIPNGNIAKTHRGGPNALEGIVDKLKNFGFTGYIRIVKETGEEMEGFVFFVDGEICNYLHRKFDGSQQVTGRQAMKNIYEDATLLESTLETHTNVDMPAVLGLLDKQTPSTAANRRGSRRAVLAWGKTAKKEDEEGRNAIIARLKEIENAGYVVGMDETMKGSISSVKKRLENIEAAVIQLEEAKKSIEEMKPFLTPSVLEAMVPLLNNPKRVGEVQRALTVLEKKIDSAKKKTEKNKAKELEEELATRTEEKTRKEREDRVYDLVIKHQTGRIGKEQEKCPVCSMPLQEDGTCGECVDATGGRHIIAKLKPAYRFDNFVVGNSNHFAHAAAMAVAKEPAVSYNPLFIWSGPGLGKTHLINSIANQVMKKHPHMRVAYFTTEQFMGDLVEAMKSGTIDDFRRDYRQADILIVDDVQFLAESEAGQEEFFHTFNSLYTVDKQIVLASDRPPKEIPTLKQRLVSRFEGGLTVEIQQPDYETRLAILKQKAADKEVEIDNEALSRIARSITTNIRELEGTLNKVFAFASFSKRTPDKALVNEVLRGLGKEEKDTDEPPTIKKPHGPARDVESCELVSSHSYLVEEPILGDSVRLFKRCLSESDTAKGMAIVRTNPSRLEKEYDIKSVAEVYWLTDRESKKSKTIDPSLERLMYEMSEFLDANEGAVLLIDGLDYLVSSNSFESLTQFIRRMVDTVAEADAILIVSVSPETLEKQQVSILEREMDVISML